MNRVSPQLLYHSGATMSTRTFVHKSATIAPNQPLVQFIDILIPVCHRGKCSDARCWPDKPLEQGRDSGCSADVLRSLSLPSTCSGAGSGACSGCRNGGCCIVGRPPSRLSGAGTVCAAARQLLQIVRPEGRTPWRVRSRAPERPSTAPTPGAQLIERRAIVAERTA